MIKKLLIGVGIAIALFITAAMAVPYFFKDEIMAKIKTAINENVNAKVDFSDVDISLFRSFPKISLRINNLSVQGTQEFDGVHLIRSKYFELNVDFWAVVGGKDLIPIRSIHLEEPDINVYVLQNEKANYDIAKPTPTTAEVPTESSPMTLQLDKYSISKGKITYDDRAIGVFFQLIGCEHSGKGDFSADIFDLTTTTLAQETNVASGGVNYLSKVKTDASITVNADMKNMKFTLKDNSLKLNDFLAKAEGWVQMGATDMDMDIQFRSPQSDFKSLLSIIPGSYTKDFTGVAAEGKFDFNGYVKGRYNENTYPQLQFNLNVDNAKFKYPNLPFGMSNINTRVSIFSPQGSDFDAMKVDVPSFALNVGNGSLKGYFFLKTPVSDPDIDTKIDGSINLAEVAQAFPMEDIKNLNGQIAANIVAKTKMSYIDNKQYERVNMNGGLRIANMNAEPKDYPRVKINELAMNFTPNFVGVNNFNAQLGKSDIQANGKIDNILAYFSPKKTMKGNLTMRSTTFDANEWMATSSTSAVSNESAVKNQNIPTTNDKKPTDTAPPFNRFDFALDAKINNLKYDVYQLLNTTAIGNFTPYSVVFKEMSTKIGNSDIKLSGSLDNVFNYLFDNQTLMGNVNIASTYMDINQFMTETPTSSAAQTGAPSTIPANVEPLRIPQNMDMTINADMKRVIYTNMDMNNLTGKIVVKDGVAKLQNTKANTLGGQIAINGGYNSTLEQPKFDFSYDIRGFDFQQAFNTFNTFATFAPIGKYMQGKFNSTLSMSGELGKDMSPNFNTLSLDGFLHTLRAMLNGFKPLQAVGNQLNISDLTPFEIKDTKNWVSIKNGSLLVSPFDINAKNIAMNIGGSHSLNNEMNYVLKAKVPRKLLEKTAATAAANQGLNLISREAGKYGLNIKNGEFVNCQFTITGNFADPKVAFKLLGTDGKSLEQSAIDVATAAAEKAKDSIRTRVEQELEKAKDKGREVANKAADSLKNVANREVDKAVDKGKEAIKDKVGEKAGEVLGEEANKKAKDAIDKGKNVIDGIFKKKKKE
jgi:hypothetical protein